MATYTEDFAGAAGSLGAPWVQWHQNPANSKDLKRDGSGHGQAQVAGGSDCGTVYNNTVGNDQYSQIQVSSWVIAAGTSYIYLFVRSTTTGTPDIHDGGSYYFFWSDGAGDTQLLKVVSGTLTGLDTANGTTYAAGDTFKLEVIGTTLKVYKNGVAITWTTSGTDHVTDSSISTGFPGVGLSVGNTATELIDNWQGGDIQPITTYQPDVQGLFSLTTKQKAFGSSARALQQLNFFTPEDVTFTPPPAAGVYNQFPIYTPQVGDAAQRFAKRAVTANMLVWQSSQDQGLPPPTPDNWQPPVQNSSHWDSVELGKNRAIAAQLATWNPGGSVIGTPVFHTYTQPVQVSPLYDQKQYRGNLREALNHIFHIDTTLSTLAVQPDTYVQDVQGVGSVKQAVNLFVNRAVLANLLGWKSPGDTSVVVVGPDTYQQPIQGVERVGQSRVLLFGRSRLLNELSWQRARDEQVVVATPAPFVPDIVGLQSVQTALRAFQQRARQFNSQLWWNYPFASVPPATPAPVISISATATQLILTWQAVPTALRYFIYKGLRSGQEHFIQQIPVFGAAGPGQQFYSDIAVTKGITYFYYVTAINVLESVPSNEVYGVLLAATSVEADVNGLALRREAEEWYTCSRCGWYYPRKDMTIQNGLYLCTGSNTRNCKDKPGHSAAFIDLTVPYEERPEPLPNEDIDL